MTVRRVTLLSDFGTVDGYAAAMAGVIAAAAPDAVVEHASHDIPPGDLLTAALSLSRYAFLYPEGSVHLVVVDPGVGTSRRAIAAACHGRFFVAPDNGVLTRVLTGAETGAETRAETGAETRRGTGAISPHPAATIVQLTGASTAAASNHHGDPDSRPISDTFHGRDLFAPAAARLARGEALESLGPAVTDPVLFTLPEAVRSPGAPGTSREVSGEVIQVDRFGNLITNIPGEWAEEAGVSGVSGVSVWVEGRSVGQVRRTYGDVETGAVVALVGSLGLLEVSVRDGSAADRLRAGRGARVRISSRATPGPPE